MTHQLSLTATEQQHVRVALRYLRQQVGGWDQVAKVLGIESINKIGQGRPVTEQVAFRVARFCRVPVDDVVAGRFPGKPTCPHCGHELEGFFAQVG
jgi:hypothetical protein